VGGVTSSNRPLVELYKTGSIWRDLTGSSCLVFSLGLDPDESLTNERLVPRHGRHPTFVARALIYPQHLEVPLAVL
jgi:hypothetical protein